MAENLNQTPDANRVHIGFFGKRNAGKSSIVNAVTNQDLSIVSEMKGTTTDPVLKTMELLPVGPVMIIDTPGIDDEGLVGELRVRKARQILNKTDVAVLVADSTTGLGDTENRLIELFREKSIPFIIAWNKQDLVEKTDLEPHEISVSATENIHIWELKEKIAKFAKRAENQKRIIGHLLDKSGVVILNCPIDESAPKMRMILPQMQTIRDVLDAHAMCLVTQTEELADAIDALKQPPVMVVTDSQDFNKVKEIVPESITLTSFSILFAQFKGILETAVRGARRVDSLKDGDVVLMSEGCTHHRQCEDLGTVKLPRWISEYTGKNLTYQFTSGGTFPEDLSPYALIVHCGGCMLNEREMRYRRKCAEDQGAYFTNYGTIIAHLNGILERSLQVYPELLEESDTEIA
ncbi:MAG: [FeFe] hydrogenase H-cluster maturation GTPase HydF [Eubacteriaceae bacterium]|jgi:[FeFe] hydrogenase H-cluster maturation GTPase HydF